MPGGLTDEIIVENIAELRRTAMVSVNMKVNLNENTCTEKIKMKPQ